jgi:hypothetical protein
VVPKHAAAYWDHATRGFDCPGADRLPPDLFSQVRWEGLMDGRPYPTHLGGVQLGKRDVATSNQNHRIATPPPPSSRSAGETIESRRLPAIPNGRSRVLTRIKVRRIDIVLT